MRIFPCTHQVFHGEVPTVIVELCAGQIPLTLPRRRRRVIQPEGFSEGSRSSLSARSSAVTLGYGGAMYRRPLQSAVRHVVNATASRAAHRKALDQESCFARALVTCQQYRVSTPCLTQCRTLHITAQLYSVKETPQHTEEEVGAFTKLIEAMGFTGPLKYNKWVSDGEKVEASVFLRNANTIKTETFTATKIKIAALRMYTSCVERVNYDEFFEKCSLPDTLNSWFLVAQLHVWMCLVRMRQEGRAGKYMCRYIVHSMWEDVEQRSKIMGIDANHRKEAMKMMTETFYAAIFGYDEGILSDDSVLAAALWRNLFNRQCEDPRQLELMVEYVRKQMQYIDALDGEDLLLTGEVKWRPLVEENAQSILKVVTPTYNDTGL
ncbi:Ubiquinol-cytochrome-c reductase complex assembly factor 1 [Channa argus]|uniref:Ubiquinol-cytochrome-c reductase complex assembly factor 1 n=1 Tax=Channa argus TaxID=215402 RepID=A0A6G1PK81_CHAAH|nr:Ubiquinol-cytochrome-c reductase complex assembly factor 1 [Channa argus]